MPRHHHLVERYLHVNLNLSRVSFTLSSVISSLDFELSNPDLTFDEKESNKARIILTWAHVTSP
jgi:hypothetical protein